VRGTSRPNSRGSLLPRGASALGEGVTDTAHPQEERGRGRVVLDLVPEVAHVDVDRLLVLVERLVVAEQLEQLRTGVDATGPRREVAEDLDFRGRQADSPVAAMATPSLHVDHEVAVTDHPAAR